MYVAAGAIVEKTLQVFIKLGPGQGKTFIIIIIALYYVYFAPEGKGYDYCIIYTKDAHIMA